MTAAHAHSDQYQQYLKSPEWMEKRREILVAAGYRCERCGQPGTGWSLQVHHLTYERLGNERREDLKAVCKPCHKIEDGERAINSGFRRIQRRESARLDGWATKVYGEDWWLYHDEQDVEEHFERWLESRGDE